MDNQRHTPVNWRQVGAFLALTFAITFAIDALVWRTTGYGNNLPTLVLLQTQMLIPAASAIVLGMFFFKDSPIYYRKPLGRPRIFFYFFLVYTAVYLVLGMLSTSASVTAGQIFSAVTGILTILTLVVLIVVRLISGREAMARAGLSGGRFRDWLLYGLAFVLFFALQTGLNALFRLGQPVDAAALLQQMGVPSIPANLIIPLMAVQTVIIGSLIGLPLGFGEEYGWRGYLQSALIRLGKKRGVLLLGLIWGVWHYPVILMGHNYPGYPLPGVVLMTLYCILLAFVLGYVMLKTGSVWLVAFLHALNNQTASFFFSFVYTPGHSIWSFGIGVYGILTLVPIVLLLLRDPVWEDRREAVTQEAVVEVAP